MYTDDIIKYTLFRIHRNFLIKYRINSSMTKNCMAEALRKVLRCLNATAQQDDVASKTGRKTLFLFLHTFLSVQCTYVYESLDMKYVFREPSVTPCGPGTCVRLAGLSGRDGSQTCDPGLLKKCVIHTDVVSALRQHYVDLYSYKSMYQEGR